MTVLFGPTFGIPSRSVHSIHAAPSATAEPAVLMIHPPSSNIYILGISPDYVLCLGHDAISLRIRTLQPYTPIIHPHDSTTPQHKVEDTEPMSKNSKHRIHHPIIPSSHDPRCRVAAGPRTGIRVLVSARRRKDKRSLFKARSLRARCREISRELGRSKSKSGNRIEWSSSSPSFLHPQLNTTQHNNNNDVNNDNNPVIP
ncbi:hypothetical protein BZA05DRAFT_95537 [Tricharina praecox]|uniref:uncharacterized protein n=1 Tax=Tricharina praecox TaxID=43433 RepID=UPI0022205539|nr:uncharacterized protein BZA05DRAFT_95537 [Tricharina praecox]KAI5848354.1 hypothetical protein BZA05DRAFT_95537 [Tricharina praecox]